MLRWLNSLQWPALTAYLFLCVVISSFSLGSFSKIIQEYLTSNYGYSTEALLVMGQVVFQWIFMTKADWPERKKYAIIALTVSMLGSLMLIPLIVYDSINAVSCLWASHYFSTIVIIIFTIHRHLILQERLPPRLTFTWILYRTLILIYFVKIK